MRGRCALRSVASFIGVVVLFGGSLTGVAKGESDRNMAATDATYYNDGSKPAADPFVRYDKDSGYYYAYSTEGADSGYQFGVYRSADLATWEHIPGGALVGDAKDNWAKDWYWAPEVYYNERTGLYFLFYSGRMGSDIAKHFKYPDFEEPSKIGVAVSRNPEGPFKNIQSAPIDYYPYDPKYHDVNLIMDDEQKKPPRSREEGEQAPLGTYIPCIDPNVYFDDDGKIYLYFSRNAYRNWIWDDDLGKYVEESNIYAVELTSEWWNDPTGSTMPEIQPAYRDANNSGGVGNGSRKDGFTTILNYGSDKQEWENAHVDDYAKTKGEKKDRRWAEGSTTVKTYTAEGRPIYYLTYSANNYENEYYGVGYAVADNPLGPWRKSDANPVLSQDLEKSMYSTGHGSIVATADGRQHYYIHHARKSMTDDRGLYTERMHMNPNASDPQLSVDASSGNEPMPSGTAPIAMHADDQLLLTKQGTPAHTSARVTNAAGAAFDLNNSLNRVRAEIDPPSAGTVETHGGRITVVSSGEGVSQLRLTYQRQKAAGNYVDAANILDGGARHERPEPISATIPIYSSP